MQRLRVLQIVPKLVTAGGQRVALDLVQHLDPHEFDVQLVSLYPFSGETLENYCKESGIHVHYLRKPIGPDIQVFVDVQHLFLKIKPQIVHNHLHALYAILPSTIVNNVPVRIHTVHSPAIEEAKGVHRFVQKIAFHKLGVLPVSISRTIQESVHDTYGAVNSPVIYNGIDTTKYICSTLDRKKCREKYGIAEDAFVFVNVASLSSVKNQRLLISAFGEVRQYFPDSFLILVGDGAMRQDLSCLAQDLGISNNVLFLGIQGDVRAILSASDCFVLSSLWEGLPISVLEAMSCSKPIISTDVGGLSELIVHGENGLLISTGDKNQFAAAILELCRDPSRAKKMGERSRQIIEQRFEVRQMAKQYAELYKKILEDKIHHLS